MYSKYTLSILIPAYPFWRIYINPCIYLCFKSVATFQDVAPNVNLPLVCSKLVSVGFYSGVVELCVACASKLDPQDKAVHYYKSDQPSQDREGHFIYYRRYSYLIHYSILFSLFFHYFHNFIITLVLFLSIQSTPTLIEFGS